MMSAVTELLTANGLREVETWHPHKRMFDAVEYLLSSCGTTRAADTLACDVMAMFISMVQHGTIEALAQYYIVSKAVGRKGMTSQECVAEYINRVVDGEDVAAAPNCSAFWTAQLLNINLNVWRVARVGKDVSVWRAAPSRGRQALLTLNVLQRGHMFSPLVPISMHDAQAHDAVGECGSTVPIYVDWLSAGTEMQQRLNVWEDSPVSCVMNLVEYVIGTLI